MDHTLPLYGAIVLLAIILAIQIGLTLEFQEQARQRAAHHRELLFALMRIAKIQVRALQGRQKRTADPLPDTDRPADALRIASVTEDTAVEQADEEAAAVEEELAEHAARRTDER